MHPSARKVAWGSTGTPSHKRCAMCLTQKIMCRETQHKPGLVSGFTCIWEGISLLRRREGRRFNNADCSGEEARTENTGRTNFQINLSQTKLVTSLNQHGKGHPDFLLVALSSSSTRHRELKPPGRHCLLHNTFPDQPESGSLLF